MIIDLSETELKELDYLLVLTIDIVNQKDNEQFPCLCVFDIESIHDKVYRTINY